MQFECESSQPNLYSPANLLILMLKTITFILAKSNEKLKSLWTMWTISVCLMHSVVVTNSDTQNSFSLLVNSIFIAVKKKIKQHKNINKKNIKQKDAINIWNHSKDI